MAYSPPHYAPSSAVKSAHDFYRPLEHAHEDLTDLAYWGLEDDNRTEHYMTGVFSLGMIVVGIGLLLVIIYWISLCCHCYRARSPQKVHMLRWVLLFCFACTGGLTLGCIGGVRKLTDGVDSLLDSMDQAEQLFQEVQADTTQFLNETARCSELTHVLNANCDADADKAISAFEATLTDTSQQVQQALDSATSVNEQLVHWKHKISNVGGISINDWVEYFGWASIGLVGLSCAFGVVGCICRSRCLLGTSAALGISMLLVVIMLVGIELGVTVFLSDLCTTEPLVLTAETIDIVSRRSDLDADAGTLSSISYYLTCNSSKSNPLAESLEQADAELQQVLSAAQILEAIIEPHCTGQLPTVALLEGVLTDMNRTLTKADSSIACSEVNPIFVQALNEASCSDIFDGVLAFWATQAAAGFCLLVTQWFSYYVRTAWSHEEITRTEGEFVIVAVDDPRYVPMLADVKQEQGDQRLDL